MDVCDSYDFKSPDSSFESCFAAFDQDKSECLSLKHFKQLCYALFKNETDQKYLVRDQNAREMFAIFDKNADGFLDKDEFEFCWNNWIQTIIKPKSALLVVDIQNDFISGSMVIKNFPARHDAYSIIGTINQLLNTVEFDFVVYTMDWHPQNHISFIENINHHEIHPSSKVKVDNAAPFSIVKFAGPPIVEQMLWPSHCVQNTPGAQIHQDLKIIPRAATIRKGTDPNSDTLSCFYNSENASESELHNILQNHNITDVYICGITIDFCVGNTAEDAISYGYRSIIIEDCCVGMYPQNYKRVSENFVRNNGLITNSKYVDKIMQGLDRRPELGYGLAMKFR